jgi:hypothetical protein
VFPVRFELKCPHSVFMCITDPSSRQRGRYKTTKPQLSTENFMAKEKLVKGPR